MLLRGMSCTYELERAVNAFWILGESLKDTFITESVSNVPGKATYELVEVVSLMRWYA